jgi:hypothetical protein
MVPHGNPTFCIQYKGRIQAEKLKIASFVDELQPELICYLQPLPTAAAQFLLNRL